MDTEIQYCDICQEKYTLKKKREHIKSCKHESKAEFLEHVSEYENYKLCLEKGLIKTTRFMTFKEFVAIRQKEKARYLFSKEEFLKDIDLDYLLRFI